ncbi:MAG TPA: hypothetical protein VH561_22735 [Micromonosporaceae bacterium]|jgi:hypothetical protein
MTMPLHEASAAFFGQLGGVVIETSIDPLEPEPDEAALGATVTVAFDNAGILGDGQSDIYDDVYPRYRALRDEWWRALAASAAPITPAVRPYLLPLPAPGATVGAALSWQSRPSRELEVVPLETVRRSPYVERVRREYSLEYGIRGASGRLFDLTEGLLLAVRAATDAVPDLSSYAELGAGTGAAGALVLRRARPKRVMVQDETDAVAQHLRAHLGPIAIETGCDLHVFGGDCRELAFAEPLGLLAIGIPYAQQPSLLARRGEHIRAALGDDGLLVAATSTVGMRFYQSLTDGQEPRLAEWPWYATGATLHDLFPCGATVRVRNLVVSIASASAHRVEATLAGMAARGAEVLS